MAFRTYNNSGKYVDMTDLYNVLVFYRGMKKKWRKKL